MVFRIVKIVGALPGTLTEDTLYFVQTGAGFDLYATDTSGTTAYPINSTGGGTSFLPVSDEFDELDEIYFYFGYEDVGGSWLVLRQERETAENLSATTGYADLTTAWPNRETLTYT